LDPVDPIPKIYNMYPGTSFQTVPDGLEVFEYAKGGLVSTVLHGEVLYRGEINVVGASKRTMAGFKQQKDGIWHFYYLPCNSVIETLSGRFRVAGELD